MDREGSAGSYLATEGNSLAGSFFLGDPANPGVSHLPLTQKKIETGLPVFGVSLALMNETSLLLFAQ